jgi:hypothetical protein
MNYIKIKITIHFNSPVGVAVGLLVFWCDCLAVELLVWLLACWCGCWCDCSREVYYMFCDLLSINALYFVKKIKITIHFKIIFFPYDQLQAASQHVAKRQATRSFFTGQYQTFVLRLPVLVTEHFSDKSLLICYFIKCCTFKYEI